MKASEIRFEEFLSQPKTNFLIPVYQRNYDWLNTQCNEFIKDIEVLAKQEKDNHFLGSVVYCHLFRKLIYGYSANTLHKVFMIFHNE